MIGASTYQLHLSLCPAVRVDLDRIVVSADMEDCFRGHDERPYEYIVDEEGRCRDSRRGYRCGEADPSVTWAGRAKLSKLWGSRFQTVCLNPFKGFRHSSLVT